MSSNDSNQPFRKMLKWIQYSGASISITLNPFHWFWTPRVSYQPRGDWAGPNEHTINICLLFLTLRFWIDDGSW